MSSRELIPRPTSPVAASGAAEVADVADCWNQRGVYGNGTCPELAQAVHCRNCTVYLAAGAQLLNRELPCGLRREWTVHFALERKPRQATTVSTILFRLGGEWLAFPTRLFQEVAESRRIHSLPHRRQDVILGLANVRGELLMCVSLGHLLGLEKSPPGEALRSLYHRLLVVHWENHRLGFPVDEVRGPHRFQADELVAPPATLTKSNPVFIRHLVYWRDQAAGVLDADTLFEALNARLG